MHRPVVLSIGYPAPGRSSASDRTPRWSPNRRGFTLMELLLVLAVMLTLAGICFPALARRQAELRFDSVTEEVRLQLARVRRDAVREGCPRTLIICSGTNPVTSQQTEVWLLPEGCSVESRQPDGAESADSLSSGSPPVDNVVGQLALHFRADGTTSESRFRLTSESGPYVDLHIDRLTGRCIQSH